MYDRMKFFFIFSFLSWSSSSSPGKGAIFERKEIEALRVCQCVKVNYTPKEDQLYQGKSLSLLNGRKYLQMIWLITSNMYKQLTQLNIKKTKPDLKMGRRIE